MPLNQFVTPEDVPPRGSCLPVSPSQIQPRLFNNQNKPNKNALSDYKS